MTLPRLKMPWRWMRYGIGLVIVCGAYQVAWEPSKATAEEFARFHGALAE